MKKTIFTSLSVGLCSFLMMTCACDRNTGNDRDCHGCINSAGYEWSALLQECIRPFEEGISLAPVESGSAVIAAYLVFNADQTKVEVYMQELEEQPILQKEVIGIDEVVWTSSVEGSPVVRMKGPKYELLLDGVVKYIQK